MLIFNIQGTTEPQSVAKSVKAALQKYGENSENLIDEITYLGVDLNGEGPKVEISLKFGIKITVLVFEQVIAHVLTTGGEKQYTLESVSDLSDYLLDEVYKLTGEDVIQSQFMCSDLCFFISLIIEEVRGKY